MKNETLQELAKLAAQKLHSDPSTLLDIYIGEELYVIEFYGYNSIYEAEVRSISYGDEEFVDDEDLGYFDELLEEQIYLYE